MWKKENVSLRSASVTHVRWQKFLKRNASLCLRAGDFIAGIRMDAINPENMNQLTSIFDQHDFENHPKAIYDMDEIGIPLEPHHYPERKKESAILYSAHCDLMFLQYKVSPYSVCHPT